MAYQGMSIGGSWTLSDLCCGPQEVGASAQQEIRVDPAVLTC